MTTTLAASQLATPPRPPIPDLGRPLTPAELEDALRSFHGSYYVQHPFHQLMYEGKLSQRQFQGWVTNRLAYQRVVPRKDAAILSNCPRPDVRRRWIARILDHDGQEEGTGGTEAWLRLAEAVGLRREDVLDEHLVVPGVRFAADAYVTFARTRPWIEGVASSLTELFAPDLMAVRLAAFERYYTWVEPAGLAYFRARLTLAPRDSAHAIELVTQECVTREQQERAVTALAFKCDVLWSILESIHHVYVESA